MSDLIKRLKAATTPDRALGNEVLLACGWTADEQGDGPSRMPFWIEPDGDCHNDGDQPNPLSSIDAAVALLPAHLWWLVGKGQTRPDEPLYGAQIREPGFSEGGKIIGEGEHDFMGAALCIALLKALAPSDFD